MGATTGFATRTTATIDGVTQGNIANVALTLANTEYAHTLPTNIKGFLLRLRTPTNALLKLSYTLGTSGTVYWTLHPGGIRGWDGISASSVTLYLQSDIAGQVVEIETWA